MIRPTGRGWVMLLATAGCIGTALVNVNFTSTVIAAGMMAMTTSGLLLALMSSYRLELRRLPTHDGHCGRPVQLPLEIVNHGWQWRQALVIREYLDFAEKYPFYETVESLAPKERRIVNRSVPALRRGFYPLKRIDLIGGDPLGCFCREIRFQLPGEVMIYPQTCQINRIPLLHRRRGIISVTGRPLGVSGIGQEFFGVREYAPHDEMRFIHWKASARQHKLMVKEFEANSITQVYLFLDAEKSLIGQDFFANNFEYLVSTAASIAEYLGDMHCRLTFLSSHQSEPIRFSGEAVGVKKDVATSLAMLEPGRIAMEELIDGELDRLIYNSVVYCLSMSVTRELTERLELMASKDIDVRWICAPRKNFPVVKARKKRQLPPLKVARPESRASIQPLFAAWFTEIEKLLNYEA